MIKLNITPKLLNLFLIFCIAACFTSCENALTEESKATIDEASPTLILNEILIGHKFMLPKGFDSFEKEAEYLSTVTEEEALKLIENHKISVFLRTENMYTDVLNDLKDLEHISDLDLNNLLSEKQLAKLESFDTSTVVEQRYGCFTQSGNCWTRKRCCYYGQASQCWTVWHVPFC